MIKETDVSEKVRSLYVVPNPYYYNLIRIGKNPRFAPETKKISSGGQLPPGAAYWSARDGNPLPKDGAMEKGTIVYPNSKLEMRDYQVEPIEKACSVRAAVIEAPTGSGKTAMAAEIIKNSGQKTLVLCHSIVLMDQFAKEIEDFLGVKPSLFYGKVKEFGDITVSTYMSVRDHFNEFSEQNFELLIVDEADCFTTDAYLKVLCNLPCKRAFGFTATLNKEEYDQNMRREIRFMERLWGFVITVETEMQTDVLENIVIYEYEKTYVDEYLLPIRSNEWHLFREKLDVDEDRKEAQTDLIADTVDPGDSAIVMLDRVNDVDGYYETLRFKSSCEIYKLHGQMKTKEREEMTEKFKEEGGILVANVKIAGRGFSAVDANKAFIMCPMRGETAVIQAVGRILRWKKDKKSTLYDWSDSSLRGQIRKRIKVYEANYPNAEIE